MYSIYNRSLLTYDNWERYTSLIVASTSLLYTNSPTLRLKADKEMLLFDALLHHIKITVKPFYIDILAGFKSLFNCDNVVYCQLISKHYQYYIVNISFSEPEYTKSELEKFNIFTQQLCDDKLYFISEIELYSTDNSINKYLKITYTEAVSCFTLNDIELNNIARCLAIDSLLKTYV